MNNLTQRNHLHFLFILGVLAFSCGGRQHPEAVTTAPAKGTASKAKFEIFNDVDEVRHKLSTVGIGELGRWRDDEMGGYFSITSYYLFDPESQVNSLAYYLESDAASSIKTLKLVLNIVDGQKKPALLKFAEIIEKTYIALGLTPDTELVAAAKRGKELKTGYTTYTARIRLEQSRIESWMFVIETK